MSSHRIKQQRLSYFKSTARNSKYFRVTDTRYTQNRTKILHAKFFLSNGYFDSKPLRERLKIKQMTLYRLWEYTFF